jgi:hypothetical protein
MMKVLMFSLLLAIFNFIYFGATTFTSIVLGVLIGWNTVALIYKGYL